jgi:hypothetical protein
MMDEKQDFSNICTHDDDNDPYCWKCIYFLFPIGCMKGEEAAEDDKKRV